MKDPDPSGSTSGYLSFVAEADFQDLGKPVAQAHLFNRWALVLSGYAAAVPAAFTAVVSGRDGAVVAILLTGLFLVAGIRGRWVHSALLHSERPPPSSSARLATVTAAGALSAAAAWGAPPTLGIIFPASVLSGALMSAHVTTAAVTAALVIGASVPPTVSILAGETGPLTDLASPLGLALLVGATVFLLERSQEWYAELVDRLNRGRQLSADLAVARERLRFAGDLHDIQGHSLQAIAIKADLIKRLVDVDTGRARAEAESIAALAREALADTRLVAHGYRETSLAREITNAVAILRAAGIEASQAGDLAMVPSDALGLFGRLVREASTNVLRHSHAGQCAIRVEPSGDSVLLLVRNDGVAGVRQNADGGSGLVALRDRFSDAGGTLEVHRENGWFEVMGRLPRVLKGIA